MLGYIKKLLLKYKHCMPAKHQNCPYSPAPKQYDAKAQALLPVKISPKLLLEEIKEIQRIIRSILYYTHTVDTTVLMALSSIVIHSQRDNKHDGESQTASGLPCNISQCNHQIPCIRYDHEHAFQRVIPLQSRHLQPCLRSLFYGLVPQRQQSHTIKWGIFYLMCHFTFRCCLCSRSQTQCPLLQL
jgi:hypothetical protein